MIDDDVRKTREGMLELAALLFFSFTFSNVAALNPLASFFSPMVGGLTSMASPESVSRTRPRRDRG